MSAQPQWGGARELWMAAVELTTAGWLVAAIPGVIIWGILAAKTKFFKKWPTGVISALVVFLLVTVFIGPGVAAFAQGFTDTQLVKSGTDIKVMTSEGDLKVCVKNAVSGAAVTSGKIYLLDGVHDLSVYDEIRKGDLKAGQDYLVMTVDSDGCATFPGKTGSPLGVTYTAIYDPGTFSSTGYPLYAAKVVAYGAKDDGTLKVSGRTIMLYQMSAFSAFDETSTARNSYTAASLTIDLNFKAGPSTADTGVENVYMYVAYTDTAWDSLEIKVNGNTVTLDKLADMDSTDPLKKNAPSGAVYVLKDPIVSSLLLYDDKIDLGIKGTANTNTTVTLYFVQNAGVEYGDVQLGTFSLTIDTAATATGWG